MLFRRHAVHCQITVDKNIFHHFMALFFRILVIQQSLLCIRIATFINSFFRVGKSVSAVDRYGVYYGRIILIRVEMLSLAVLDNITDIISVSRHMVFTLR